jgi:hypothetical protein
MMTTADAAWGSSDETSLALHALDDAALRLLASGLGVCAETVIAERVPHTPLQWMCSALTCFFRMPRMSGNGSHKGLMGRSLTWRRNVHD